MRNYWGMHIMLHTPSIYYWHTNVDLLGVWVGTHLNTLDTPVWGMEGWGRGWWEGEVDMGSILYQKREREEEESNMYCTYMKVTPKNIYSTKEGILIRIYMQLLILFINSLIMLYYTVNLLTSGDTLKSPLFDVSLHRHRFLMMQGGFTFRFVVLILVWVYLLYLLYVYVCTI